MRRMESGPAMAPMMMVMNAAAERSSSSSSGGGGEELGWGRHFDNSDVNAISFGFVATAILISMFLLMAIFERFLRPPPASRSPPPPPPSQGPLNNMMRIMRRRSGSSSSAASAAVSSDLESQHRRSNFSRKLDYPSPPKMSIYAKGVSVLMPGNDIPTYIAHPAPAPCAPEHILWPPHDHNYFPIAGSTSS